MKKKIQGKFLVFGLVTFFFVRKFVSFFNGDAWYFFSISNFLRFPCLSSSFFIYVFAVTQSLYAEVKNMKIYVLMTRQEQEEWGKMCGGVLTLIYKNEKVFRKKLRWIFNQNPKISWKSFQLFHRLIFENSSKKINWKKNLLKFPSSAKRTHLFD